MATLSSDRLWPPAFDGSVSLLWPVSMTVSIDIGSVLLSEDTHIAHSQFGQSFSFNYVIL